MVVLDSGYRIQDTLASQEAKKVSQRTFGHRVSGKIIQGTIIHSFMATESPIRILEGTEKWPPRKQSNSYGSSSSAKLAIEDFSLFLKDQKFQSLEKDMIPYRSESAPPSMGGSIAAIENIFSLRKSTLNLDLHPGPSNRNCETDADLPLPYHGSDVILDQRFSRPFNSDSRHLFHRLGSTGNDRNMIPHLNIPRNTLPSHEEEPEDDRSSERSVSASVDESASSGFHNDSFNSMQGFSGQTSSSCQEQYNHKSMGEKVVDANSHVHNHSVSMSSVGIDAPGLDHMRQVSQPDPLTGGVSTLSLDDESGILVRPPLDGRDFNAGKVDLKDDSPAAGVGDTLSFVRNKFNKKEQPIPQNYTSQPAAALQESNISRVPVPFSQMIYPGTSHPYGSLNQFHYGSSSVSTGEVQPTLQASGLTPPFYTPPAPTPFMTPQSTFYQNMQPAGYFTPQYSMGGYAINSVFLPSYLSGYPSQGTFSLAFDSASFPNPGVSDGGNAHAYDTQNLPKYYEQVGVTMQPPSVGPYHMQYFQRPLRNSYGTYGQFDHQAPRNDAAVSQVNSRDFKRGADLTGFPNDQKPRHSSTIGYNRFNIGSRLQFPSASIVSPVVSIKPVVGTNFSGARNSTTHYSFHGNTGKTYGLQNQSWKDTSSNSFLEEMKLGKGQRFELSDLVGHIGEFSVDQHGSRFIQQKLEHCSLEERESVFKEVVPHASKLMTDVFGNYVIQKIFEYGSPRQKEGLANQLEGQILPLSLQMYGCRVIQKAFEVIDLAQKARLAKELDGHVMRCVRDQNGNHVIQKCIESIPADNIQFIISSFRGQVATLSMHPYGCRVIQRVLEHCNDELQIQFIVSEILDSVCALAQDQYGNYVTQHVLARGIPRERSEIIEKLSGSVVQLSQHKFASNVVEKCLEYGDSVSRDLLIKEIIGHGDKNDNILLMMKDQYANYVIQKILQKCTNDQRELLLGVIRSHLTALKKYTYGKHTVVRLEQVYGEEIQSSEL